MNLLRKLGSIKYKLIRVIAYLGLFNSFMLVYIEGWHTWYLLLIPAFLGAYYFESKFGIPGELDVAWKSSKEWQAFKHDFYELRDRLIKL